MLFKSFEWKIGIRYLRAKQKDSFVSFIALVSIIGIMLGVASLITVISVMNGFQHEIRAKIIGVSAHMEILDISGQLQQWQSVAGVAKLNKEVVSYAPYVDGQALITFDGGVNGVMVRGILPSYEQNVENTNQHMLAGNLNTLIADKFNVIIGRDLARQLGVSVGDKITLLTPNGNVTPAGMIPRVKQFTVTGIFFTHMSEYDSSLVLINLQDAQILFKMKNAVTGVRLKVADIMRTTAIKEKLMKQFPDNITLVDWIDEHKNYFAAVDLEKKMMFVILTLIVAVAAFNLVSTLVMTVNDKKSDIAILRTMGASKFSIMKIFLIQGAVSGIIGTVGGTILGLLLASYVGNIVHGIELITGAKLVSGDVYMIDYLPSQIIPSDVILIFSISILLSILATIYPSYKAACTDPVEALRHE